MKIKKIHINGFGKLSNLSIDLDKKINVIFGNNESGKSTLQTFIKGMLFSLKGGRRTKKDGLSELKKYQPIDNMPYSGSLSYVLDDSSEYLVERNFDKSDVKIYDVNLKDISSEFDQDKECGVLFAKKHLGISPSLFENTCFIKQANVSIEHQTGKNIIEELSSNSDNSLDIISFKKAYDTLNSAIKNYVGTDRTSKSPMDIITNTLNDLYKQQKTLHAKKDYFLKFSNILESDNIDKENLLTLIENSSDTPELSSELKHYLQSINEYETKIDDLNNTIDGLSNQLSTYKSSLSNYQNNLNKNKIFRRFSQNTTEELISSNQRKDRLYKKRVELEQELALISSPKSYILIGYYSCLAISILCFLSGIYWQKILLLATSGIFALIFFVIKKYYDNIASTINQKKDYIKNQLSGTKREIIGLESVIETTLSRANVSSIEEFINKKSQYDSNLNLYNSYKHSVSDCEARIEATKGSISDYQKLIQDITTSIKSKFDVLSINKELASINQDITINETKKRQLEQTKLSLQIAIDTLTEANDELSSDFIPKLNEKLCDIIHKITNNCYSNLSCNTTFNLNTINSNSSSVVSLDYLSGGTIDQIYLALRIGLCDVITEKSNESLPLIFDEVFATYDDNRTSETIQLLNDLSDNHQIILFTCKNREVELMKNILGDNINIINL